MKLPASSKRSVLGALRAIPALSLVVAVLSWEGAAAASPTFPAALVDAVPMGSCTPGCAVCHRDNNGGPGTAVKPFAGAMLGTGMLVIGQPETVKAAVEALRAKNGDLDNDGTFDIVELAAGHDPNVFGAPSVCVPTYGCGARIAPVRAPDGAATLAVLGAAALIFLRRRAQASGRLR